MITVGWWQIGKTLLAEVPEEDKADMASKTRQDFI